MRDREASRSSAPAMSWEDGLFPALAAQTWDQWAWWWKQRLGHLQESVSGLEATGGAEATWKGGWQSG